MKKKWLIFGLIGVTLVLGLLLAGCDTGTGGGTGTGDSTGTGGGNLADTTWVATGESSATLTLKFSDPNIYKLTGFLNKDGTYTASDTTITLYGSPWPPGTISGTTMTFKYEGDEFKFIKQ